MNTYFLYLFWYANISGVDVPPPDQLIGKGTAPPLRCLFPMKEPPLFSSGVEKLFKTS